MFGIVFSYFVIVTHVFKEVFSKREMDGWTHWNGKKVFIILKNRRQYSGTIINVDLSAKPIIFLTILDKFGNNIMFAQSEIDVMQEEKE